MPLSRSFAAAVIGALAVAVPAQADPGHAHFSAGVPGDPKKPARVIEVLMREGAGTMSYVPDRVEVKRGEQVRFVIRNVGELPHEFILASTADNLKHAEAMEKNPDMAHEEPNGIELASKKTGEFIWKFTKAGEFEYACLIPGHRDAGMIGTVVVK